jgi:hypothetical protein
VSLFIGKTYMALAPDVTDPPANIKFHYFPFPALNADMYIAPRPVPCYADEGHTSAQSKVRWPVGCI